MKTFELLYTTPKRWLPFSELIKWRYGTEYSHVCFSISTGPNIRTYDIIHAANGKVHDLDSTVFLAKNKVVDKQIITIEDENYYRMIRWLKLQRGKSYSEAGALATGIPFLRHLGIGNDGDDSFICSEFAVRGLEIATGRQLVRNDDYFSPEALYEFIEQLDNTIR